MRVPKGKKVLIIDDDPDIVDSVGLILANEGYELCGATSAEDGLAKVQTEHPDLILLDIMMPDGTEGFQFVWRLRNELSADVQNTPVLVLTSIHSTTHLRFYPDESDPQYAPGEYLPVQGFIDKPGSPEELVAKVAEILEGPAD
jgi:CheY-like chemotaxis protein